MVVSVFRTLETPLYQPEAGGTSVCLADSELPACSTLATQPEGSLLSNCSSTNRGISLSNTGSSRHVGSVVFGRTRACLLKKDCALLLRSRFMARDGMATWGNGRDPCYTRIRSCTPDLEDPVLV